MILKVDKNGKAILDSLFDQLTMGWLSYSCGKALDEAYRTRKIISAYYFFRGTYVACVNEALLSLAKLTTPDRKSITVHTLLKYAGEHPAEFKFATGEKIEKASKHSKTKLRTYKALLQDLVDQRDKILAHFDKINIENPDWNQSMYIDMRKVERCYRELLGILNIYYDFYERGEYRISNIDEGVEDDVRFLVSRIGKERKSLS